MMVIGLDSTKITDSFLIFLNKNVQGTNLKLLSNMPYPQFMFYCRSLENNFLYPSYLEPVTITKLFFFLFLHLSEPPVSSYGHPQNVFYQKEVENICFFFFTEIASCLELFFFFFFQQGWLKAPYSSKVDISLSKKCLRSINTIIKCRT